MSAINTVTQLTTQAIQLQAKIDDYEDYADLLASIADPFDTDMADAALRVYHAQENLTRHINEAHRLGYTIVLADYYGFDTFQEMLAHAERVKWPLHSIGIPNMAGNAHG